MKNWRGKSYRCNWLTWEEEGSMVIMTSLVSEISSGDCFVGIPSSENFFMEFSFLIQDKRMTFHSFLLRIHWPRICRDSQGLTCHEQSLYIQPWPGSLPYGIPCSLVLWILHSEKHQQYMKTNSAVTWMLMSTLNQDQSELKIAKHLPFFIKLLVEVQIKL